MSSFQACLRDLAIAASARGGRIQFEASLNCSGEFELEVLAETESESDPTYPTLREASMWLEKFVSKHISCHDHAIFATKIAKDNHLDDDEPFVIIRRTGSHSKEGILRTTAVEALQFIKAETNLLLACTFSEVAEKADEFMTFVSQFSILAPPFDCRFLLQDQTDQAKVLHDIDYISRFKSHGNKENTPARFQESLARMGCTRISYRHAKLLVPQDPCTAKRDEWIFCSFGFRKKSTEGDETEATSSIQVVVFQDLLPADQIDLFVRESSHWGSALGVNILGTESPGKLIAFKEGIDSVSSLIFKPSFTIVCEPKDGKKSLLGDQDEVIMLLEIRSDPGDSDCFSDPEEFDQFMASTLSKAVSPLADEICNSLVPGLAQNLCLCLENFSDLERSEVLDALSAKSNPEACAHLQERLVQITCQEASSRNIALSPRTLLSSNSFDSQIAQDNTARLTKFLSEICLAISGGYRPSLAIGINSVIDDHEEEKSNRVGTSITFARTRPQTLFFCRFLKAVQIVFSLLKLGKVSTKRGEQRFGEDTLCSIKLIYLWSQITSDKCLEALSKGLQVPRYAINVVSFSRGLVFGALAFRENDGSWLHADKAATVMPSGTHTIELDCSAETIFVIEKECIFRRLLDDQFIQKKYNGRAILITGCGFPDVQTRVLLNRLSREFRHVPIYGIADFDPHGVEIMATYRFGSKARSHEADILACESLRWIGVQYEDIERYKIPNSLLLELTKTDVKKCKSMIEREAMLDLGMKAEIEVLNAGASNGSGASSCLAFLSEVYIHDKLRSNMDWESLQRSEPVDLFSDDNAASKRRRLDDEWQQSGEE